MVYRGKKVWDGLEVYKGGAALLTEDNVMVIADLHLGCEAALEYDGLAIPRVQTKRIGDYISDIVKSVGPRNLVVAGDLKHNFSRNLNQEWSDVSKFAKRLKETVPLSVVKGNHDNYLGYILGELGIQLTRETTVSDTRIIHGHTGELSDRSTIMGHIHPSLSVRDEVGARLKSPCFLCDPARRILVLPSLSLLAGGVDVATQTYADSISPLLSKDGLGRFIPIVFSGESALTFPSVERLRKAGKGV